MNLHTLDLNLFLTFEAIYAHGNLTQAARALNITQPAVSNALSRLRHKLDDPLFIHAGRKMNPTPMAQKMISPVRQALRLLDASIDGEEMFTPALSEKTVRISIGDIGETILLPKLVERLSKAAPLMKVQAFHVPRRSISKKLALGELDFAVDIPLLGNSELIHQDLMSNEQVCVVGETHPLAGHGVLTLDDYLGMNHILVSSRQHGSGIVDVELGRLGPARRIAVRLEQYQAAFHMLSRTDLALTAPLQLTKMYKCRIFPLPLKVPTLDFHLFWHKSADQTKVNAWLRAQIFAIL